MLQLLVFIKGQNEYCVQDWLVCFFKHFYQKKKALEWYLTYTECLEGSIFMFSSGLYLEIFLCK